MADSPKPIEPKKNDVSANNATSTVIPNQNPNGVPEIEYSEAEEQYHFDVMKLIRNARIERERSRIEFNDMGFSEQDDHNIKLDLAYVPPAKNKFDIRIVSGMTREKTNTAVAMALSYDFDAEFVAYDKEDTIISALSTVATDLVEKSNQLEYWRQSRAVPYRGMVARGTYFTLETQEFPTLSNKSRVPLSEMGKEDASWEDRPRKGKVQFRTLEIDPKMVILGDLKAMTLEKQPFMAVGRIIFEAEARSLFGTWDRWSKVPLRRGQFVAKGGEADFFDYYQKNFSITDSLTEGEVELTYFMRSLPYGNELGIYLNGMSMLPIKVKGYDEKNERYKVSGFPLTPISASGEYPLVDWQYERIPGFFYSKGQPAKTKFDQDVLDFWFRFMIKKAIRSINPTLGNKSGQQLSQADLQSGNIISNIRKDDLFSILPPEMIQGISNGEVSMMEMLKKEIDEKTTSREFAGQTQNQHQSATQFSENKKAQVLQLGALIDGIVRGEMRRAELRLQNSVIPYWMSIEDKKSSKQTIGATVADIYDTFTLNKEGKDGKFDSVMKVGKFEEISSFDIMADEERQNKEQGQRNKYTYLNPEKIDFVRTLFYVNVKPRERDNDAMHRMLFDQDVASAKNLFGPEATNDESLKVKFAQMRKDDYETWFIDAEETAPEDLQAAMAGMGTEGGGAGGMNPASTVPPERLALQS